MTTEQITILALFVLSVVIYLAVKKLAGIKLNVIGLLLFWPIVLAVVNSYSSITKILGVVLALFGIYLLSRSIRKAHGN